jgi:hypothetical protein
VLSFVAQQESELGTSGMVPPDLLSAFFFLSLLSFLASFAQISIENFFADRALP